MRTPGLYENIPNNEYHADKEWLSSSQIKVALNSALAYKYFVMDGKGEKKTSTSKDFGSVVHKLILEEKDFFNEYYVADLSGMDLRTKAGKEMMAEHTLVAGSRIVISKDDYDKACACYDSVMSHPDARRYLELPGVSEASVYVELDHTLPSGEMVKFKTRVRPDRLVHGTAILDLKTTKNPSKDSFVKDALADWGYGYDVSAALYVRAIAKLTGEILPFIFIAVRNDAPYECGVYKLKDESMKRGEARLNRALNTIIMAQRAGVWEFQSRMEEI
jgi:hypothetical protein